MHTKLILLLLPLAFSCRRQDEPSKARESGSLPSQSESSSLALAAAPPKQESPTPIPDFVSHQAFASFRPDAGSEADLKREDLELELANVICRMHLARDSNPICRKEPSGRCNQEFDESLQAQFNDNALLLQDDENVRGECIDGESDTTIAGGKGRIFYRYSCDDASLRAFSRFPIDSIPFFAGTCSEIQLISGLQYRTDIDLPVSLASEGEEACFATKIADIHLSVDVLTQILNKDGKPCTYALDRSAGGSSIAIKMDSCDVNGAHKTSLRKEPTIAAVNAKTEAEIKEFQASLLANGSSTQFMHFRDLSWAFNLDIAATGIPATGTGAFSFGKWQGTIDFARPESIQITNSADPSLSFQTSLGELLKTKNTP